MGTHRGASQRRIRRTTLRPMNTHVPAWAPPDATPDLRIKLDQPQRWPSANDRGHWSKNAPVIAYWRQMTACLAKVGQRPRFDRVHVVMTLHWPDRRRRDVANWHPLAKACVDGLVDAQVVPDDHWRHVVGPDLRYGEPVPGRRPVAVLDVYDLGSAA